MWASFSCSSQRPLLFSSVIRNLDGSISIFLALLVKWIIFVGTEVIFRWFHVVPGFFGSFMSTCYVVPSWFPFFRFLTSWWNKSFLEQKCILTPCFSWGFSQHIFLRGGCCNPPSRIINTEGHITLNLLPMYRYGHPLSIDTKISTNH